ncbi:unnamed protein product (macronuclear) [Paramecium tetraurelia]|uniref:Uncharacterized protein n=1 Tax=Paramecium tetraurelia TaxID=5888 RepID=A0BF92_PARTE|nr:uncharacterized protein GSPATT00028244001 [Paramecium tetraurelia]CAK57209.1 unnamed protein product [Paramecium tetraurelia]|eukprot:XP_001424607.1 hypothetical protein (macronuclear) [Paramecium tetraurelia strain d4-2]
MDSILKGSPMSKDGPLGYKGPLATIKYYGQKDPGKTLFETNDFAFQLRAFGLWSALGPIGPFRDHWDHWNQQELIDTEWILMGTTFMEQIYTRTYPLYEFYQSSYAKTILLDTSFLVENDIWCISYWFLTLQLNIYICFDSSGRFRFLLFDFTRERWQSNGLIKFGELNSNHIIECEAEYLTYY